MCNRLGKFTHVGQNKCPLRSAHVKKNVLKPISVKYKHKNRVREYVERMRNKDKRIKMSNKLYSISIYI